MNPEWNYDGDLRAILIACIGCGFGPDPENRLDDIRLARGHAGHKIARLLNLKPEDRVVDIGSGCGFVGRTIAPTVAHLYCCDISQDFLEYCDAELAEFGNVSAHKINYADLSFLEDGSVSAVYSTAVFIHFNYYDMVLYLQEVSRILSTGGRVAFDILNADRMSIAEQPSFSQHCANYRSTRTTKVFNVVHPFSLRALEHLLPQLGFKLRQVVYLPDNANTTVVAQRD